MRHRDGCRIFLYSGLIDWEKVLFQNDVALRPIENKL
jgi:hypothetical protein